MCSYNEYIVVPSSMKTGQWNVTKAEINNILQKSETAKKKSLFFAYSLFYSSSQALFHPEIKNMKLYNFFKNFDRILISYFMYIFAAHV